MANKRISMVGAPRITKARVSQYVSDAHRCPFALTSPSSCLSCESMAPNPDSLPEREVPPLRCTAALHMMV